MRVGVELVNDELVLLDARPLTELSFSAVGSCSHHHCLADLACDQDLHDTAAMVEQLSTIYSRATLCWKGITCMHQ